VTQRVEPFDSKRHDRKGFTCGDPTLDEYLARQATQDVRRNVASLYCFVEDESPRIIGYYTLCASALPAQDLPEDLRRALPRYSHIPAVLLGRLAVLRDRQGEGIGGLLLANAVGRTLTIPVAAWCLVVDALHPRAAAWYGAYGFRALPDQPLRLILPTDSIRKLSPAR
jgi:GNAT superfamily N-acetyltransferase